MDDPPRSPPDPSSGVPDDDRRSSGATLRARLDEHLDWLRWIGPVRLVSSVVAVLAVGLGAYWLTRSEPPSEAALPIAVAGPPSSTLPPPLTVAEPTPDPGPASVTVHVSGQVVRPGVYELRPGERVQAAVDRAGGPTAEGDPNAINLAAPVADGTRIYVPAVGEDVPLVDGATAATADDVEPHGPVDVNRASIAELDELPGVGPATAEAIVTERERNGPFATVEDLQRVPGIGPAKLDAVRDLVTT